MDLKINTPVIKDCMKVAVEAKQSNLRIWFNPGTEMVPNAENQNIVNRIRNEISEIRNEFKKMFGESIGIEFTPHEDSNIGNHI
jgi:hypothetical protein